MTTTDWFGLIFTITIAILMLIAYVYAFNPKRSKKFEKFSNIPNED